MTKVRFRNGPAYNQGRWIPTDKPHIFYMQGRWCYINAASTRYLGAIAAWTYTQDRNRRSAPAGS